MCSQSWKGPHSQRQPQAKGKRYGPEPGLNIHHEGTSPALGWGGGVTGLTW